MREVISRPPVPRSLRFLYGSRLGGLFLRAATRRWVSRLVGKYLDSKLSRGKIKHYVRKHGIRMEDYIPEDYRSFNAFFTRRIRPELRPFDLDPDAFVSPCDAKLSVYPIDDRSTFTVKGFDYTVHSLVRDPDLSARFVGGQALVFRLSVTDYHRYFFIDDGVAESNRFIAGRLHTVQPVALGKYRVFTENCREVTLLHTAHFGDVAQVEVGAMMVGRIVNDVREGAFSRGQEKGRFEFGGSTVILLVGKDAVSLDPEFREATRKDCEVAVRCGEKIGTRASCAAASDACCHKEKEKNDG